MSKPSEILIAEVTPDDSRRLQQLAFKAGYGWQMSGRNRNEIKFEDNPFLAANMREKRLYRASFRQSPWPSHISEVSIRELSDLFTRELMIDCTIPEGDGL